MFVPSSNTENEKQMYFSLLFLLKEASEPAARIIMDGIVGEARQFSTFFLCSHNNFFLLLEFCRNHKNCWNKNHWKMDSNWKLCTWNNFKHTIRKRARTEWFSFFSSPFSAFGKNTNVWWKERRAWSGRAVFVLARRKRIYILNSK